MFRFAANLNTLFGEYAFRDRFGAARRAGFSAVELLHPYAEPIETMKDWLTASRVHCVLINNPFAPQSNDFGTGAVTGKEDDFASRIDLALSYARALEVPAVHVMAGDAKPTDRNNETFIKNLRAAGKSAAELGITLTIEPLNARDRPKYFLRYTDQAAEIIRAVGLDNVKLQFDLYHVQITEGDLIRRIERLSPIIGHVQVAGVPFRAEPDEGEVNLAIVLDALSASGYNGYVGCEYKPRGKTEAGLGWLAPFARAVA